MLGDLATTVLVLLLGYAYPALECYKSIEKNKGDVKELRFWCQYWILVAILTVFERVTDIFISWLPMYGELKVLIFVYLWFPQTKGTEYVFDTILRVFVAGNESDIEEKIKEMRARAWDFLVFYWQNGGRSVQTPLPHVFQSMLHHTTHKESERKQKKPEKKMLSFLRSPEREPKSSPPGSPSAEGRSRFWRTKS